jgi:hypothetical protein
VLPNIVNQPPHFEVASSISPPSILQNLNDTVDLPVNAFYATNNFHIENIQEANVISPTVFPISSQPVESGDIKLESCHEFHNGTFFTVQLGTRNCAWLSSQPSLLKEAFCKPASEAYDACPKTCGKCDSECLDIANSAFLLILQENVEGFQGPQIRGCEWLREYPNIQSFACVEGEDAYYLCAKTCKSCNSKDDFWLLRPNHLTDFKNDDWVSFQSVYTRPNNLPYAPWIPNSYWINSVMRPLSHEKLLKKIFSMRNEWPISIEALVWNEMQEITSRHADRNWSCVCSEMKNALIEMKNFSLWSSSNIYLIQSCVSRLVL